MQNDTWLVVLVAALVLIGGFVLFYAGGDKTPANSHQRGQFHTLSTALELYADEFAGYPPSDANDPMGVPYCGAMKLCEGVMGQDLLRVRRKSVFRADGRDAAGQEDLYPYQVDAWMRPPRDANLSGRWGPSLSPDSANAYRLVDIYGEGQTGPFDPNLFVLCDTYLKSRIGAMKTGMPILYYRADPNGTTHDADDPDNPENIFDYRDNQMLLALGVPDKPDVVHPLSDPKRFYQYIQDASTRNQSTSRNANVVVLGSDVSDSYILISAGQDGLYGTEDDVSTFDWQHHR